MGHQRDSSAAVIAAVVVAGLLLLVIVAGGLVVLGGLFFFARSAAVEQVAISDQAIVTTIPMEPASASIVAVDAAGQITFDGQPCSDDELRERIAEQAATQQINPLVNAHPDCPQERRDEVIAICNEATGVQFSVVVDEVESDGSGQTAPSSPPRDTERGQP